jgi:hypothetical protein
VQDADEDVAAQTVGTERVRGRRGLEPQGEVGVGPGVVDVHDRREERDEQEDDDHDEAGPGRRARDEAAPRRRGRASTAARDRDRAVIHRDLEGGHQSYLIRGSTAA